MAISIVASTVHGAYTTAIGKSSTPQDITDWISTLIAGRPWGTRMDTPDFQILFMFTDATNAIYVCVRYVTVAHGLT